MGHIFSFSLDYKPVIFLVSDSSQAPRKFHAPQSTPQKYCSDRCRREKPRPALSPESDIERTFVQSLGDGREGRVVRCEEVERMVFGRTRTEGGVYSEDEELSSGAGGPGSDGQSDVEEEPEEDDGGVRLPPEMESPVATAVTTTSKKPDSENRLQRSGREWGMQKAKEREMVRRAARRGVAFGFLEETGEGKRRKVEAVQGGRVVESSFAKGEWGVRWKE